MSYLNEFYLYPLIKAFKRWKTIIYNLFIDLSFLGLCSILAYSLLNVLMKFIEPLGYHDLENYELLTLNLTSYSKELNYFYLALILGSLLFVILIFLLYSFSRTLIWNNIIFTKKYYLRNLAIHAIHFFIGLFILIICISFIEVKYYLHFIIIFFLPWVYYSLYSSMNLGEKKIIDVFRNSWSYHLILLLPHFIIFILIVFFVNINSSLLILVIIFLNIFRIFIHEVKTLADKINN
jgi:hypothetical protein